MVAFFAWEAAIAPRHAIYDEHLRWVGETVLTAEQRAQWRARDLDHAPAHYAPFEGFDDDG